MNGSKPTSPLLTARLIWVALNFSMLLYGFALFTLGKLQSIYIPQNYSPLDMAALASSLILIFTFTMNQDRIRHMKSMEQRLTPYIICWALHEIMVLLAFAAVFQGSGNTFVYAINLTLALIGNIITFPKEPPPSNF